MNVRIKMCMYVLAVSQARIHSLEQRVVDTTQQAAIAKEVRAINKHYFLFDVSKYVCIYVCMYACSRPLLRRSGAV